LFQLEGLIAFRALCFLIISWIVYQDLKIKEKNHVFEEYTFICEVLALIVFFLLTLCSILKYEKYISNMEFQNSKKEEKMASQILETGNI
jgi:tellurite resistance protein TehA-like permease